MEQNNNSVKIKINSYWIYYFNNESKIENCGKWMHFFEKNRYQFAKDISSKAIKDGIVQICKHTSFESNSQYNVNAKNPNTGVICFYINGKSLLEHKRVLEFFIENDLIQRTKSGRLYNISFKFDSQTFDQQYGDEFIAEISLCDFINLETGNSIE